MGQAWALVDQVKPQLVLMDLHFASSEWINFLRRLHYSIIGDTVNTAQRIESLTRSVLDSSGVLISQSTFSALGSMHSRYRLVRLASTY